MVAYAPAWLRRGRRVLVPALLAAGIFAFGALAGLPPFEQAVAPHFIVIAAGAIAWPLLVFLMNGEPLPGQLPFEMTSLDATTTIAFTVRHDERSAMAAQGEFWLRSARELRFGSIVVAPVAMAFFACVAWKVARDTPAAMFFGVLTLLTIAMPAGLFFVGRRTAAARAARFPELHVRVGPEGIAAGAPESSRGLAWSNIARVWESERSLTLVLNPYMAVQLPRDQVPEAARELILSGTRARPGG